MQPCAEYSIGTTHDAVLMPVFGILKSTQSDNKKYQPEYCANE